MQTLILSVIGAVICLMILCYYLLLWRKAKNFATYHPALTVKKRMLLACIVVILVSGAGVVVSVMRVLGM